MQTIQMGMGMDFDSPLASFSHIYEMWSFKPTACNQPMYLTGVSLLSLGSNK